MKVQIRNDIASLNAYPAGKPISEVKRQYGLSKIVKMASNENPLGCSPKAAEAVLRMINELNLYPDPSAYELKHAIAKRWGVDASQIFCGTGTDLLIRVICMTVLNPGDETVMGEVTFIRYADSARIMGGKPVSVPMKDDALDLRTMADAISPSTKIIWLCNPNNPTGTMFTKHELEDILDRIPDNVLIVMDEAYYEYVTDSEYPESISYIEKYPNMVVLRTFSKAYGLAGARVGYGICCSELARYFNAVIGPFDVNAVAQAAAAAAVNDLDFVKESCEMNREGKEYLYREFDALGLSYVKTQANFMMVKVPHDDMAVFNELLKHGVIVKTGSSLGMPGYLRVSIGSMEQNVYFIEVLKKVINR